MNDHERFADFTGAYVLGALEDDEREAFLVHLQTCPACRDEVDELQVAVDALPMSAPPTRPSPALKSRIMAEVEREATLLASAAGPGADRAPRRRRRSWRFSLPMPALAAMACGVLLVGLGLGALVFGSGSSKTVQFASTMQGISATLQRSSDQATLVATGLPAPPRGRVYQVWLQEGKRLVPTNALFMPRGDGSATASVAGDLKGVDAVVVNTEPDGGSDTPTSAPVMTATLS